MARPTTAIKPLPFREAVEYFDRRAANLMPTDRWTDMWQEEHSTAFTVARSAGYDILGDIAGELRKAIADGGDFKTFAANLKPTLQRKGWWGVVQREDGEVVQLGSLQRLRTIYDVNLRVSFAAGAWERAQRTKRALPYIVYEGIDDDRQRPIHHSWMGTCLPIDHQWWDTHWAPCGWRCRCWNRQVSRLEAREIGITEHPPSGPPKRFFNPSTGAYVEVPHGIDPGFGYNVGKAALEGKTAGHVAKVMADKLAASPPRVAARRLPSDMLADQTSEFADWLNSIDRTKPKGEVRVVGALGDKVLDFLSTLAIDRVPASGAITLTDHAVAHILRDAKAGRTPDIEVLRRLPILVAVPDAILWDRDTGKLLYVVALASGRGTRLVIELDRMEKARDNAGKRTTVRANSIVSGQVMDVNALLDRRRYEVIDGRV